jgi:hypothetical protein
MEFVWKTDQGAVRASLTTRVSISLPVKTILAEKIYRVPSLQRWMCAA